jgi:hypothetical protein
MTAMAWKPVLSIPKTCLMLPLGGSQNPREWAERKSAELLSPDVAGETRRLFIETLEENTVKGRASRTQVLSGLVFYPGFDRYPPICDMAVDAFRPGPDDPPSDLESWRETNGKPQPNTIGDIETTEIELSAGPALRFHERREQKIPHQHGHMVGESILYAVRPPEIRDSVSLMVTWMEPQFRDMLIKMADGMAQSLKIVPREN